MKIKDLIREKNILDDTLLKGDLIAIDAYDGKVLFDTSRNKQEFIEKYLEKTVLAIWADVKFVKGIGYSDYFKPVTKCYVDHWEDKE